MIWGDARVVAGAVLDEDAPDVPCAGGPGQCVDGGGGGAAVGVAVGGCQGGVAGAGLFALGPVRWNRTVEMPEASVMVQSKVTFSPGPTVLGEERETADNSAGVTSADAIAAAGAISRVDAMLRMVASSARTRYVILSPSDLHVFRPGMRNDAVSSGLSTDDAATRRGHRLKRHKT